VIVAKVVSAKYVVQNATIFVHGGQMVSSQRKDIPVVTAYKFKTDTHQHIVYVILYVHYIVKYLMVCMKECYVLPPKSRPK